MKSGHYTQIERTATLTTDKMAREVRENRRPLLLTGAATKWPAAKLWTPEYFASKYGSTSVRTAVDLPDSGIPYDHYAEDHFREMPVAAFVEHLRSPSRSRPCYLEAETVDHFSGLDLDIDFAAITPSGAKPPVQKLWIGSANTRSGLHFDNSDNFLAQIRGRKKAYLIAPDNPAVVYPYRWNVAHSPVDPGQPDHSKFPKLANATIYEATLEPGDVLFIPAGWWHFVQSLEPSISVNSWFSPPTLWMHARILARGGPAYWLELGKQFVVYGVLRKNYRRPLFATDPPGRLLYRLVREQLNRRGQDITNPPVAPAREVK